MEKDAFVELRRYVEKRLAGLNTERLSFLSHWRQLSDYILPRRGRFLFTANAPDRGAPVGGKIVDPTATLSARTLASGLMSGLTSPARPWFRLKLRNPEANDRTEVRLWLDEVQSRMRNVLSQSNIYNCLHTVYEELGTFGTAAMMIEEDHFDLIRGTTLTAGQFFLGTSGRGEPDTLYRESAYTVAQLVDRFALENVGPVAQRYYEGGFLDQEFLVAQAIEPNDKRGPQPLGLKGRAYRSCIWLRGHDPAHMLEVKGYHEKPFIACRWHINGNEAYGRSPGMDALPDVKMLQKLQQRSAQAIDKILNPPMVADVSMRNEQASLLPGGVTYVQGLAGVGFKPAYTVPPDIRGAEIKIAECQKRIERAFFADLFLMISQLDTVRTATEVIERKQEKMLMLGPFLERAQFEIINPLIERLFAVMLRIGLLPPPPPEAIAIPLDIECISTLADAQKSTATTGIERLLAFVGNLAAAKLDVMDNIDFDTAVDIYAEYLGVTPKIIASDEVVNQIRQGRAKQAANAQAVQNASAAVQGAQTLSETDVGGGQSALQRMIGPAI